MRVQFTACTHLSVRYDPASDTRCVSDTALHLAYVLHVLHVLRGGTSFCIARRSWGSTIRFVAARTWRAVCHGSRSLIAQFVFEFARAWYTRRTFDWVSRVRSWDMVVTMPIASSLLQICFFFFEGRV